MTSTCQLPIASLIESPQKGTIYHRIRNVIDGPPNNMSDLEYTISWWLLVGCAKMRTWPQTNVINLPCLKDILNINANGITIVTSRSTLTCMDTLTHVAFDYVATN